NGRSETISKEWVRALRNFWGHLIYYYNNWTIKFFLRSNFLPLDEDREVEDKFFNSGVHVNVDVEARDDDDADGVDLTKVSNKKKGKGPRGKMILLATVERINGRAWIVILRLLKKLCMLDWRRLRLKVQSPPTKVVNNFLSLNVWRLWKGWEILMRDNSDSESNLEVEQHELKALELASTLRRAKYYHYIHKRPCHIGGLTGYAFVQELLNDHPDRMYNMFRMDAPIFLNLC
ncbi:hypothetical protein Ddye_023522, partial [Dipteronia dyeriana]